MTTLLGTLHPIPPYDFAATIRASRHYTVTGVVRDGAFWQPVRQGEATALVAVRDRERGPVPTLEAHVLAQTGTLDRDALLNKLRRMFQVQADLTPFYRAAERDPALWRIVEPLRGIHILQTDSVFEALVVTMNEQQISLASAQKGERWLVEWGGEGIAYNGEWFPIFPGAPTLANATVEDLTPLKITFQRMQRIIDVAKLEVGESFERLRTMPTAEAYQQLMALKGVGHWTAAWTITRGLGNYMYVGAADVALRAAVNHFFYGETGRAEKQVTDETYARYGHHAGLAGFYTLMRWAFDRYGA